MSIPMSTTRKLSVPFYVLGSEWRPRPSVLDWWCRCGRAVTAQDAGNTEVRKRVAGCPRAPALARFCCMLEHEPGATAEQGILLESLR